MHILKNLLVSGIKNIPGWRTPKKIVVIESDDWGSNRMPSREVFEILKEKGLTHDGIRYDRYDTLANEKDLADLFDVLHSVKDIYGSPAKMTPVSVVANPDYKKIEACRFKEYYYELFTDTLKKRGEEKVLQLWREGIDGGFFIPQYHGREHLNVAKWMKALQSGHEATHEGFKHGVYGVPLKNSETYLAAYDFFNPDEIELLNKITIDGLKQFENVFGFRAKYFVPPNGPLSSKLNETLAREGVQGIQIARFIYSEPTGYGKTRKRLRYFGMKTSFNQAYTLRNVIFEPNEPAKFSWVDKCLSDIETAFQYRKPAVISSHRVNYIGALVPENRYSSLSQFRGLLQNILKNWPDVQFLTSGELTELMFKKRNDHK